MSIVAPRMSENSRRRRLKTIARAETRKNVCSVFWNRAGGNKSRNGTKGSQGSGRIRTWLTTRTAIASVFTMIVRLFGRSVPEDFSGFHDGLDSEIAVSDLDAPAAAMPSVLLLTPGRRCRPAPDFWRLAVNSIFHHDRRLLAQGCSLFFHLLEHVDHVLRRPVIKSVSWSAITLAELCSGQGTSINGRICHVIRLRIERSPAKVASRDETSIDDRSQLKGK